MKPGTKGSMSGASLHSRGTAYGGFQGSMRSTGRLSRGQLSEAIPDLLYQTQEGINGDHIEEEAALSPDAAFRMENTNPTHSFKKNIHQLQVQVDKVGSQLGAVTEDIDDLRIKYQELKDSEYPKVDEIPAEINPILQQFRQRFRDFIAKQKSETFKIQKQIAIVAREKNHIVEDLGITYDRMRGVEERLGLDRPRTEGNPRSVSADIFTVSGHSFNKTAKSRFLESPQDNPYHDLLLLLLFHE